jgi:hypothetical protein
MKQVPSPINQTCAWCCQAYRMSGKRIGCLVMNPKKKIEPGPEGVVSKWIKGHEQSNRRMSFQMALYNQKTAGVM